MAHRVYTFNIIWVFSVYGMDQQEDQSVKDTLPYPVSSPIPIPPPGDAADIYKKMVQYYHLENLDIPPSAVKETYEGAQNRLKMIAKIYQSARSVTHDEQLLEYWRKEHLLQEAQLEQFKPCDADEQNVIPQSPSDDNL